MAPGHAQGRGAAKSTGGRGTNITPLLPGTSLSSDERERRLNIVRYRLGRLARWSDQHFRQLLESNGWDVDAAINQYHRDLVFDRADVQADVPSRSGEESLDLQLRAAGSAFENHRIAVQQLHDTLQATEPENTQRNNRLTSIRLAIHLNDNNWDLEAAYEAFVEADSDQGALSEVERRIRRLRICPPGATLPNVLHRDERLALLLDFTATDDWVSVRDHLAAHQWDLHRACDAWMRAGIRNTSPSCRESRKARYHEPRMPHEETENRWRGRTTAPRISGIDDTDRHESRQDYGSSEYPTRLGWLYHAPLEHAKIGIQFAEATVAHKIHQEKGVRLCWHGPKDPTTQEVEDIDWNNQAHINALNKWFSQVKIRTQGRPGARVESYQPDENQFIYDWHRRRLDEHVQWYGDPRVTSGGGSGDRWPIKFSISDLFDDFNTHFHYNDAMAGPGGKRRLFRTKQSLDMRRRRIPNMDRDFGIPLSHPRPTTAPRRTGGPPNIPDTGISGRRDPEEPAQEDGGRDG